MGSHLHRTSKTHDLSSALPIANIRLAHTESTDMVPASSGNVSGVVIPSPSLQPLEKSTSGANMSHIPRLSGMLSNSIGSGHHHFSLNHRPKSMDKQFSHDSRLSKDISKDILIKDISKDQSKDNTKGSKDSKDSKEGSTISPRTATTVNSVNSGHSVHSGPGTPSLSSTNPFGPAPGHNHHHGIVENITLVLYGFTNVLLTNNAKYDGLTQAAAVGAMNIGQIILSYGGPDRINNLRTHFEYVLKNNDKIEGVTEKVLCFLLSDLMTNISFASLKRVGLAQYFITVEEADESIGKKRRELSHVIGCNHVLRRQIEKEYLMVLKLMHVLKRDHENVLYIGNSKEVIDHLTQINACHTHYVKTKGMTFQDVEYIRKKYRFGLADINAKDSHLDTVVEQDDFKD